MAIAKKPHRKHFAIASQPADDAAEVFIPGAEPQDIPQKKDTRKVPIMARFDRALLQRVDAAAKHRGIS